MNATLGDEQLSNLLLRACHDLRSAGRNIRTHSEMLLHKGAAAGPEDLERHLGFAVDGAKRLEALLDGLAGYAVALRTDLGAFETFRMGVIVRAIARKLNVEAECGELPEVTGSRERLTDLCEHLLRNAAQSAGDAPARVTITAGQEEGHWRFTVRDHGPGVDEDGLGKIFEPFERLGSKGRAGLGLAISRVIVEKHGGKIWAEPAPGGGLAVHFTLPA